MTNAELVPVGIKADAIERITQVSAEQAVEELIWNAIDAEASHIEVSFERDKLDGIVRIVVSDDGHGIPVREAKSIFGSIGGSAKRRRRSSPKLARPYHGKKGQGRYKALSLGNRIEWRSRALSNGSADAFSVILRRSRLSAAEVEPPAPCDEAPGCTVIVEDITAAAGGLNNRTRWENVVHRLAPYLIAHPSIRIVIDGEAVDVANAVARDETVQIETAAQPDGRVETIQFDLKIFEWHKPRKTPLFLCDVNGVSLGEVPLEMKSVRFSFSAYVLSENVRELHEQGRLGMGVLDPAVQAFKEAARNGLREYFRMRQAEEAQHVADRMRREGLYPYTTAPANPIERAERQVFDVCAATVHEYLPGFEATDRRSRSFTYSLLREALESNPSSLGKIFKEVLKLTGEQQEELAHLLGRTSLGAIIQAAKTVADRLAFINGLEQILHGKEFRKRLKERSQLHRILVEELWIFGDQYALGADDVSLKTILTDHRKLMNLQPLDKQVLKRIKSLSEIPDLLLWRQYLRRSGDQYEHLVIELKRPSVNISQTEIGQIKKYASKVVANKHFDKGSTKWKFLVLSDGIAADADGDVNQLQREPGHVIATTEYDVWALTWAQIIQEAKVRLDWIRDRLELQVTEHAGGMEYLRTKYPHLLPADPVASD